MSPSGQHNRDKYTTREIGREGGGGGGGGERERWKENFLKDKALLMLHFITFYQHFNNANKKDACMQPQYCASSVSV